MPARKMDPRTIRRIVALETALARRDPDAVAGGVAALLDDDFVELGASGRRWDRAAMIAELDRPPSGVLALDEFVVEPLGADVLLVTYRSVETPTTEARREVRRVSIWIRRGRQWRMRFHQGTIVPPGGRGAG